jgi:hypothetical protein
MLVSSLTVGLGLGTGEGDGLGLGDGVGEGVCKHTHIKRQVSGRVQWSRTINRLHSSTAQQPELVNMRCSCQSLTSVSGAAGGAAATACEAMHSL